MCVWIRSYLSRCVTSDDFILPAPAFDNFTAPKSLVPLEESWKVKGVVSPLGTPLCSFKHPHSQTHKISVPGLWLQAGLCTWPAALSSPHLGSESSGRSSPAPPAAGRWKPCDFAFVCGAGIHNVPPKWCLEMYSRWKTRKVANLIIGICTLTVE